MRTILGTRPGSRRAARSVVCLLPLLPLLPLALAGAAQAQGQSLNPQISVIGDTRAVWSEADDDVQLAFEEAEIALTGPVNPYASAAVYLAIHGTEGIEVEEAKLMLDRYFPAGFGLTVGRSLIDFGQLNTVHPHAYPWVVRPLMTEEFFGEDGVADVTARLDWLAPLDAVTLRATAGAVRGDLFRGGHDHDAEEPHDEEAETGADPEIGVSARVDLFVEPARDVSFLMGASLLHGVHDPAENAAATWIDADLKLRWEIGPSRALVLNAEWIRGSLDGTDETAASDPDGFFASADLRIDRHWNVGGFGESATERFDDTHRTARFGGFVGLALMEETTVFRLVGARTDPDGGEAESTVFLQALFGLGPHSPHRY